MLLRLKFITMIGFVFAAVCLITLTNATLAHDGDDVSARSSHWYAEPFERPGLLGKPYIDVRYTHIKEDQSEFPLELDEPLRGMILSGNAL